MQARSELKYVAVRPWCKAISQAVAFDFVNTNCESKEHYKINVALCNVETTISEAAFILPTLAPQDRFANYDVEAGPVLNELHVTHRPRLYLDSWGLNPKVYGLPRLFTQPPPAVPVDAATEGSNLANDSERNMAEPQANQQEHGDTRAHEKPVIDQPFPESQAEKEPVVTMLGKEDLVAEEVVREEPATGESMTENTFTVSNDNLPAFQEVSKPDSTINIDTKLAQSCDRPWLSTSSEDRGLSSLSSLLLNAMSLAASTPEKKRQVPGNSTAPISTATTPEKGGSLALDSVPSVPIDEAKPSALMNISAADKSCLLEGRNCPAEEETFSSHSSSLSAEPVKSAQAAEAVGLSADCGPHALISNVQELPARSKYSMLESNLSFAKETFSFSLDPMPNKSLSITRTARTSPAKVPTHQASVASSEPTISRSSPTDQSNSDTSVHDVTEGKGPKKANKKNQKKAAKKARKAKKADEEGDPETNASTQSKEPSPTVSAASISSSPNTAHVAFPSLTSRPAKRNVNLTTEAFDGKPTEALVASRTSIIVGDDQVSSQKSPDVVVSSFTTPSPKSEQLSFPNTPPLPSSPDECSLRVESSTPVNESTNDVLMPLPTEEKIVKKSKAQKKNAIRKARRANMKAVREKIELQHFDGQDRPSETSIHDVSTFELSPGDAFSALDDETAKTLKQLDNEAVMEKFGEETEISNSSVVETTPDVHNCGDVDDLAIQGEDGVRENLDNSQAVGALTMNLESSRQVVILEMQDRVDSKDQKEHLHEHDETTYNGRTIRTSSDGANPKVLTTDGEDRDLGVRIKSRTQAGSKAVTLVKLSTFGSQKCPTLKVAQAPGLFFPRCLLVPRGPPRRSQKMRALLMLSDGQKQKNDRPSPKNDTFKIKEEKGGCRNAVELTATHNPSASVVQRTQSCFTKDIGNLHIRTPLVSFNTDRLLTYKPWTVHEDGRNLEIPAESSVRHKPTEASGESTPQVHKEGGQSLSMGIPQVIYNPYCLLLPIKTPWIFEKIKGTASGKSCKAEVKDKASGVAEAELHDISHHTPSGSTLQQAVDGSALEENMADSSSQEDGDKVQLTSLDDEVCVSTPQEIYNPHCLLLPGETSWIIEKMNATASGDFDEKELQGKMAEPPLQNAGDPNRLLSLEAAATESSIPSAASPSITVPDPFAPKISKPCSITKAPTTLSQLPTTAHPFPTASVSTPSNHCTTAPSATTPAITSALAAIDIAKAAAAVQEAPEDKCLLLQLFLVLVVRLVCLCFK